MATDYIGTAEAGRIIGREKKTVQRLWRAGRLDGYMQHTIGGSPSRLMISRESAEAFLAREMSQRSPVQAAQRGLPTGVLRRPARRRAA